MIALFAMPSLKSAYSINQGWIFLEYIILDEALLMDSKKF